MAIKRIPKVGEDVYIRGALFIDHGEDDREGGLAKVASVKQEKYAVMITVEEIPGWSFSWDALEEEQDELKKKYGAVRAYPYPDYG